VEKYGERALAAEGLHEFGRLIVRAVVADHELVREEGLAGEAGELLGEETGAVISGHRNRDSSRGHPVLPKRASTRSYSAAIRSIA